MTQVVFEQAGDCRILQVTGHAGYAEPGQDIVCAACSILAHGLIAALLGEPDCQVEYGIGDGLLWLRCRCGCEAAERRRDAMFDVALAGFELLAETYAGFVEVKKPPEGGGVTDGRCPDSL